MCGIYDICLCRTVKERSYRKTDLHHAWKWGRGRENRPSDQALADDSPQWRADVPSTDAASEIHSITINNNKLQSALLVY